MTQLVKAFFCTRSYSPDNERECDNKEGGREGMKERERERESEREMYSEYYATIKY